VKTVKENQAVERVVRRLYRAELARTGRLPGASETRAMERRVREAAEASEKRAERK